ncbi:hypothetical protein GCM10009789_47270 [Kribbella sancticallisti]|uniref:Amidohydrolase-related domain-containing protein n=1 Tax=Kribbella sancticallisti TaxID=460087 RepID=A0ABP4PQL4_9ACTN
MTPIEVLERTGVLEAGALIAHGCGIVESDLPILRRFADRTAVATCPKVYLKLAMGSTTPIRQLWSVGIEVGVGTDGAAVHNTLDVWESLRLVALTQKHCERNAEWMTISDTLRLATRGGAAAAGLGDTIGAIEPGRRADIALVDLSGPHCQPLHDPRAALVYSVRSSDVVTVIVDGQVVCPRPEAHQGRRGRDHRRCEGTGAHPRRPLPGGRGPALRSLTELCRKPRFGSDVPSKLSRDEEIDEVHAVDPARGELRW